MKVAITAALCALYRWAAAQSRSASRGRRHPPGRHRSPDRHDRSEDLRPVSRTHQPLGRGWPLRRADPRRRLRGPRLRDVLDGLRAAGRGARRRDAVRAWHEERADHRRRASRPGIRQGRIFLESGRSYDGSVWIKIESGAPRVSLRVLAADGSVLADRSAPGARIGVAGSAVLVRERAHRSRRDRRDRRRRTRRGARRFRVADARRRAQERHAASRSARRRSGISRPRSSAGPAARSPRPTSGRTASARSPRASTTRTKSGAATPTTTASAPTSTWS